MPRKMKIRRRDLLIRKTIISQKKPKFLSPKKQKRAYTLPSLGKVSLTSLKSQALMTNQRKLTKPKLRKHLSPLLKSQQRSKLKSNLKNLLPRSRGRLRRR